MFRCSYFDKPVLSAIEARTERGRRRLSTNGFLKRDFYINPLTLNLSKGGLIADRSCKGKYINDLSTATAEDFCTFLNCCAGGVDVVYEQHPLPA